MVAPRAATALFAATAFLSSFLLFLIEPLQGKMLLPLFGGAPMVWNTCMVFFQAILLFGYLTAHLTTKLRPQLQVVVQLALLAIPVAFLPLVLPSLDVRTEWLSTEPMKWLLVVLAGTSGPAFFVVATASPLLQTWYARTGTGAAAKNPYVLYAAGNLGSLLALLAYPTIVEPSLRLSQQSWLWTFGYAALVLLFIGLGVFVWRTAKQSGWTKEPTPEPFALEEEDDATLLASLQPKEEWAFDTLEEWSSKENRPGSRRAGGKPSWGERALWVALAFVPSSVMLGVTTYMTTDVAAIPMLWILPLAIYILSFAIVFWKYPDRLDRVLGRALPIAIVAMLLCVFADYRQNLGWLIALHLVGFFLCAMVCHGRLAARRPAPKYLTEFYLWLSIGGVFGGLFNTLIAPNVFKTIAEYPLILAASLVLAAGLREEKRKDLRTVVMMMVAVAAAALLTSQMIELYRQSKFDAVALQLEGLWTQEATRSTLVYGIPLLAALCLWRRPWCMAAAVVGVVILSTTHVYDGSVLYQSRSFFGTLTVRQYDDPASHSLAHGGILHGEQRMADPDERAVPRSYYHPDGPLGQLVQVVTEHRERPKIGAIGLGTGAIAAYGTPDNEITFYELNPHVEKIARDPKLFTYVDDCLKRWCHLSIVIGDGRLKLLESRETYDLIVVDAFSSDSIPVHLITKEALDAYLLHLNEGGLIAFHISNRYVNLEPVLLNLANERGLGYALRYEEGDEAIGKGASTWAVIVGQHGLYEHVIADERWRGLEENPKVGVWADDYANVLRTLTWY